MEQDQVGVTMIVGRPGPQPARPAAGLPWLAPAPPPESSADGTAAPAGGGAPAQALSAHPDIRSGRLRDEGVIARGGMGAVHRVYDTHLRRHVALKVLDPTRGSAQQHAQRFVDEARVTGALNHPNIVPVHDLSIGGPGEVAYTMKLVEGTTLATLIERQSSQRDLERILQCLAQVCDVLAYAHSRGIVHRDLKPDNVMVGGFGEVVLMDWGCALALGERSLFDGPPDEPGSIVGTVRYMSPEQARGDIAAIGPASDVFSVGAMLYRALTGQVPYGGSTQQALARAARADYRPVQDCTGMAVQPPPMLASIVNKAMAADPARRHASAADLADDLRDFLRGGNWFPLHVFPAGRHIVREGDWADAAYVVTSGRCEVRRLDPADPRRHVVLRTLGPGEVFGETGIFADTLRSASVVALEEVRAVRVDRASLEQLASNTTLGMFVKALAQRFLELDGRHAARGAP